jgi:hypothetical protein
MGRAQSNIIQNHPLSPLSQGIGNSGSFVMYTVTGETTPQIGRVVDVVSTRDLVPQEDEDNQHLVEGPPQGTTSLSADAKMPAQFVKVNRFKCVSSFMGGFPVEDDAENNALPWWMLNLRIMYQVTYSNGVW